MTKEKNNPDKTYEALFASLGFLNREDIGHFGKMCELMSEIDPRDPSAMIKLRAAIDNDEQLKELGKKLWNLTKLISSSGGDGETLIGE